MPTEITIEDASVLENVRVLMIGALFSQFGGFCAYGDSWIALEAG